MNLETLSACPLCGGENIRTVDTASNICECDPCGYVFDNPRPTVEELIAFYSQPTKYDSWLAEEKARDLLWERRLKLLLRVMKPGSLLDVGAGIGQFLMFPVSFFIGVRDRGFGKRHRNRPEKLWIGFDARGYRCSRFRGDAVRQHNGVSRS